MLLSECIYFFFQAEDGIRDLYVTGVQTCALPISGEEGHVDEGQNRAAMDHVAEVGMPLLGKHPAGRAADRKSTRLNSSHVEISYAVFCLKKKKETDLERIVG